MVDRDGIEPPLPGLQPGALPAELSIHGGEGWSRTNKALGAPGLQPGCLASESFSGADDRHRTRNLPLTRRLLCQLSYVSVWRRGRRTRAQPCLTAAAFPLKGTAPTITQSTLLKSVSGHKKTPVSSDQPGFSRGVSLEGPMFGLPGICSGRLKSSVPRYSWRGHKYGQRTYVQKSHTAERCRSRYGWHRTANACERHLLNRIVLSQLS